MSNPRASTKELRKLVAALAVECVRRGGPLPSGLEDQVKQAQRQQGGRPVKATIGLAVALAVAETRMTHGEAVVKVAAAARVSERTVQKAKQLHGVPEVVGTTPAEAVADPFLMEVVDLVEPQEVVKGLRLGVAVSEDQPKARTRKR